MAAISTLRFLPEVFRTQPNEKFLGATLDQLVSPGAITKVNGFIGRTFAPTFKTGDNYVPEITEERSNYQLEAGISVKNKQGRIEFATNYIDLLQNIKNQGGYSYNQDRLFSSQSYSFDGHFDYDKFVNFKNYYWLPNGPDTVEIRADEIPYTNDYTVSRVDATNGYSITEFGSQSNPLIYLARGGEYTFSVSQPGYNFWIQTEPGISGTLATQPDVSTRTVLGVENNGTDAGTVTFKVPQKNAQDFYLNMIAAGSADAAIDMHFNEVQGALLSEFLTKFPTGLDGFNSTLHTQWSNKTVIFINKDVDPRYWTDSVNNDAVIAEADRRNIWKITLTEEGNDYRIVLVQSTIVSPQQTVFLRAGNTYAGQQFWLNGNMIYEVVPFISANLDYLYYQDSSNPDFIGVIKIVDNVDNQVDVEKEILGKKTFTSQNGVVFTNGLRVTFDSTAIPVSYQVGAYYVEGVGDAIRLVAEADLIVPEEFSNVTEVTPDYITINRGSRDLNPWSRSNRWVHADVINAVAAYNKADTNFGLGLRAARPIIEFEADLQLVNFGREAHRAIDIINFDESDAFVDIEGQTAATLDNVNLHTGQKVIFANDRDVNVSNKIYEVTVIDVNNTNYINLQPVAENSVVQPNQCVLIKSGSHAGKTYWFNGSNWVLAQAKTGINQYPQFDIVDSDGFSYTDTTMYPSTTFTGTSAFSYKIGTGNSDSVIGYPLSYQNFNNIGDIVFQSDYDVDTFSYTKDQSTVSLPISSGYLVKNKSLTERETLNNWAPTTEKSKQYQILSAVYDGTTNLIKLDVLPDAAQSIPYLKVYVNNVLLLPSQYNNGEVVYIGITPALKLTTDLNENDKIDVLIYTQSGVSSLGYYQVPDNLDLNALNEPFKTITLGQLRNHYNKLIENTTPGPYGLPPLQDVNLKSHGGTLVQSSSPVIYSMLFLNNPETNFVDSINLARREYSKFKNKFLELSATMTGLDYTDPVSSVDSILQNINAVKNKNFSWYYSDMVPQGGSFNTITYNIVNAEQNFYEINSIFNDTVPSNRAVLVYHNGVQLTRGIDYVFNQTRPSIDLSITLVVGDTLVIREYANTDGNYIPETPSKLGLYPSFAPQMYQDSTYVTPTYVIQGHDGSTSPAFGDFRDDFLLELEKRIYNNIKLKYENNSFDMYDVVPGRFRNTRYSLEEFNAILHQSFLQWIGNNNINFSENQWFEANNPWTWNYSQFPDKLSGQKLQGSWRAIFNYWFDTDQPHLTPWKMLGFGSKPTWWEDRYGPAPYTGSNALLWKELAAGYVWNNGSPYIDNRFVRSHLTDVIPVDDYGNLKYPSEFIVQGYISSVANINFAVGHESPTETAWKRSSDYPFAMQVALALTTPGRYFGTQIDVSTFVEDLATGQVSDHNNNRINPSAIKAIGTVLADGSISRPAGYINWVCDYIKSFGVDPIVKLNSIFSNLNVQLMYKVAGFTDKSFINVLAEQTSPGSTNSSIVIPDENYHVYLNESVPIGYATYSAVIVERTASGFVVSGYDTSNPMFNILPSISNNNFYYLNFNNIRVKINRDYDSTVMPVAYGTEFATEEQLCDFLVSYQRYLEAQGFEFTYQDLDLGYQRDWFLSVREFVVWVRQGWEAGNIIVLSPINDNIVLKSRRAVVGEVTNTPTGPRVLDQNFNVIRKVDFTVARTETPTVGNSFTLTTLNNKTICFAKFELIQTEHVLVFDNTDVFNDIIYVPSQGSRQYRLKLIGSKTGNWTGALDAGGFVFSDPEISNWQPGNDYRQGDLVLFNNKYYTAPVDVSATSQFDISKWTEISKSEIRTGLLPGFAYNAEKFDYIYDVDKPPVDRRDQEFSAGLIGFRERSYLTDLGISLQNQVKFYQGYIRQKGTMNAVTALTNASFNNTSGNIDVYEEWAFRVGSYGGTNSNPYVEFVVDDQNFNKNPSALTYTTDVNSVVSKISVPVTSANLHGSSVTGASTQMFGTRLLQQYHGDIPTAGYVNIADVDYTIYDLNSYHTIGANVGRGQYVWSAKSTDGQWGVYRITESRTTVLGLKFSLDTFATVTFDGNHDLEKDDIFVVKGLNPTFDGFYQVSAVPSSTMAVVNVRSGLQDLIKSGGVSGTGTAYKLQSVKLNSLSDLTTITPPDGWQPGDKVWVNNATVNGWGVYEYSTEWKVATSQLNSNISLAEEQFGTTVKFNVESNIIIASDSTSNLRILSGTGYTTVSSTALGAFVPTNKVTNVDTTSNVIVAGCGGTVGQTGYVDLYRIINGTGATAYQRLANASPTINDQFGNSVSVVSTASTCWLAVGAPGQNYVSLYTAANASGFVNFTLSSSITAPGSNYGQFVKFNQDATRLFVAATGTDAGKVYLYTRLAASSTFTLTQTITAPDQTIIALFGSSMDIDTASKNLYVGANANTLAGKYNGQVYRYIDSGNVNGNILGTKQNPTVVSGSIVINGTNVAFTNGASLVSVVSAINLAGIPGIIATNSNGYLFVESKQLVSMPLTITPGTGTAYTDLGLTTYSFAQMISQPNNYVEGFAQAIAVSDNGDTLAVSSKNARTVEQTTYDNQLTTFDIESTKFVDEIINSGAVYIYQLLEDVNQSVGTYVYGQELSPGNLHYADMFGTGLDLVGNQIVVGVPGDDLPATNNGGVYVFSNPDNTPIWDLIREQQTKVDINSINRVFVYNKKTNALLSQLDYFDPAKGKLLKNYDQDIDYKTVYDPAFYNLDGKSEKSQYVWGPEQVGHIWWNLDTVRYVDYEQDSIDYRLLNWGSVFPGSSVDVYEWVESTTLPSSYTGDGVPLHSDDSAYSSYGYVNAVTNTVNVRYYFWVKNKTTVAAQANKVNSVYTIAEAIKNPRAIGLPYMAAVRNDTVGLYNINHLLTGKNTVVHINTKSSADTNVIHGEYELVQEGNPNSALPKQIVKKMIDSISGIDSSGNLVPDPALPVSRAYGIDIRPRQSMFINVQTALDNVLNFTNLALNNYPVVETKNLTRLKSKEPIPSTQSGNYTVTVNTYQELSYIDLTDANNHKALVLVDINNSGKWAIYEWNHIEWVEVRVQSFNTNLYWSYTDWYDKEFDPTTTMDYTVPATMDIARLSLVAGSHIKVQDSGNGSFVVYKVNNDLSLTEVGIQNGTIVINSTDVPGLELRNILESLLYDIFINDLAYRANQIFFSLVKYVLTEQENVDWVFKTSFLSAKQELRKLSQTPLYVPDNQSYYLDYIKEVAPYKSVIREFVVDYLGNDNYGGDISDFDLPSYYDKTLGYYRSPNGEQITDADMLSTAGEYRQWFNNYTYSVVDVIVEDGGTGYILPPKVTIEGGGGSGATAVAHIDSNGTISSITIVKPGTGFTYNPTITINGTGTGAKAYPVLRNVYAPNDVDKGHNVVRSIDTTIKFDRTTYTPAGNIVNWNNITTTSLGTTYPIGSMFYYEGQIYTATVDYTLGNYTFDISNVAVYDPSSFSNACDRISAYYQPGNSDLDYGALMTGIQYPGVQVEGPAYDLYTDTFTSNLVYFWANTSSVYSANTQQLDFTTLGLVPQTSKGTGTVLRVSGSQKNNYNYYIADVSPSTITLGLNQVYDESLGANITFNWLDVNKSGQVDSIIQNFYTSSVGVNPEDILIDGGKYYDTFSSHAPEELVPGVMFDHLNMSVYTNLFANTQTIAYRVEHTMHTNPATRQIVTLSNAITANAGDYFYQLNANCVVLEDTTTNTVVLGYYNDSYSNVTINSANIQLNHVYQNAQVINVETPQWPKYYKIDPEATSVLTANLSLTDSVIHVANASVFGEPNTEFAIPGVVYVNGEKITYYVRDTVNNTLGQLRRAVDGTGAPNVHITGSSVVETNAQQVIPSNPHTSTWYNPPLNYPAFIGNDAGQQIQDGLGDVLVTIPLNSVGITDSSGFEGSYQPQVTFLKGIS